MTEYQQSEQPAPTRPWRGPRTRFVTEDVDGRRRIVVVREGALPDLGAPLPLRTVFTPPARRRIPKTAAEVAAHFKTEATLRRPRFARPASPSEVATPEECRAMRARLALGQREASEQSGVSRGVISELESPRAGRRSVDQPSPQTDVYVAWLRRQVALLEGQE